MKINDVILHAVTKIVVFILLTMAVYLFLSGHHNPGGGFIGGIILAAAFVLLFLAFDMETVKSGLPFDFKIVAAIGAFISVCTGFGSLVFGEPFLSMTHGYFELPYFGNTELTTITIFEIGVALTVVGVVVTIILTIGDDV
ncbi:Na(+)/H(+) antiporter subunit B [Virgibacillus siamensis]|uniref:Na(+)/H(+) antiporter subunit B n=1 Tax=Virgibacillus siamensis TaxID=480071 RepID=UPI0009849B46|nr:Na(+)/H(+) antiporter subunit B [Virgibacillus siamensis]